MDPARPERLDPSLARLVEETRSFYAQRPAGRGPDGPAALAVARSTAPRPAPAEPPAVEEQVGVDGRSVPVRIHLPSVHPPVGAVLDLHGGGFYLGSAADDDLRNRRLADALGVVVVGVDYRLAPEHPWPAAADDCEIAARWLAAHALDRFGTTAIAITGFSAGATLAMTTLLRLRGRVPPAAAATGASRLAGAVLQFGTYDLSGRTRAGRRIAAEYFLEAYAGAAADRSCPDISPVFADLAGLPPVLMVVGAADVLLADNRAMAARLAAAGTSVDLRVYPEVPHGFTRHPTPMARAALGHIDDWLAGRLAADDRAERPPDASAIVAPRPR